MTHVVWNACFETKITNFMTANVSYIKRNISVSALFQASEQKNVYTEGRQPKKTNANGKRVHHSW